MGVGYLNLSTLELSTGETATLENVTFVTRLPPIPKPTSQPKFKPNIKCYLVDEMQLDSDSDGQDM